MKYSTLLFAALSTSASAATMGSLSLWQQSPLALPETGKPVPGQSPLKFCGPTDDDTLTINYVNIAPNPPTPGATLEIQASGNLKSAIEDGSYVILDVKYGFIKLIHKKLDVCENSGEVDLKCPIEKGELVLKKEVKLPREIPPGKYHVTAQVFNQDDEPITCITADVFFHPGK